MNRIVGILLVGLLGLFLAVPLGVRADTRYVSAAGAHVPPFASWPDAATNIQAAIQACNSGDVVIVSNGTYVLTATIQVTNHITLASAAGREAVLLDAGALAANQDAVFLQFGTLDGFTVSNAPRHGVKSEYGAVYNSLITHSRQNGIDSYTTPRVETNSTLIVTNTIVRKSATNGIYTCAVDTRISDCFITDSGGAGVSLRQNDTVAPIQVPRVSNFVLRTSTLSSNRASGVALAFWDFSASLPTVPVLVEDCIIEDNVGVRGGGISDGAGTGTDRSSGVQINRCIIRRNRGTEHAGGIVFLYNRSPTISCSIIEDNSTPGNGGGLAMESGSLINCLVQRNKAGGRGGGFSIAKGTIDNNTVLMNEASISGGGFYNWSPATPVRNCIVYYNSAPEWSNGYWGVVSHSCITPANVFGWGPGNITNAPNLAGFRNWRLIPNSPCVDAGSFALAGGDYDLEGDPRIWGGGVDMGCDEYYPPGLTGPLAVTVEVSAVRAVVNTPLAFQCNVDGRPEAYEWQFSDGVTVSNTPFVTRAFATAGVYTAVVTAWNNDSLASGSVIVEIFPGYTNYVSPVGAHVHPFTNWPDAATNIQAAIAANIPGGVVLVADGDYDTGGVTFGGGLTNRIAITNAVRVISQNGPESTRIIGSGPLGDASARCAYVSANARLVGFTLSGGHTRLAGDADRDQSGGGAWCEPGGILENCWLRDNAANQSGGGLKNGQAIRSRFWNNRASLGGAASGASLSQCVVTNNEATSEGGGVHGGTNVNCLVAANRAPYGGGGSRTAFMHATVAHNHATQLGGGVYRCSAQNSIVHQNTADLGWSNFFNSVFQYSCTEPDPQSTSNAVADPLFVDAAHGVYRLLRDSPALDAARASDVAVDLDGVARPLSAHPGQPPVPDMGAYEYTAAHYVAPGGGHVWPFSTWADAANDIQSAVDAADPLDLVYVSNGVYNTGGRIFDGPLTNRMVVDKPLQLLGVNGHVHTIIEGAGPVGEAAIRGIYLGTNALLAGFTVRFGATATAGDPLRDQSGGGVWCAAGAVVSNCVIRQCAAQAQGGGVRGGRLVNTFITGSTAAQGGGAAQAELSFCTVTENTAADAGGALDSTGRYSIVYFNSASGSGPNLLGGDWDTCCTLPAPPGPGHLTNDPGLFAAGDYRLTTGSPCIDYLAPHPSFTGADLDKIPRPLDGDAVPGGLFDLGAQEFIHPTGDTDRDGLYDEDEIRIHQTSPFDTDTDGDDQSDLDEVISGMDPLDPASLFAIVNYAVSDGQRSLSWPGRTQRLYSVFSTSNILSGTRTYHPDYTNQPGVDGIMSYTNFGVYFTNNYYGVGVRRTP